MIVSTCDDVLQSLRRRPQNTHLKPNEGELVFLRSQADSGVTIYSLERTELIIVDSVVCKTCVASVPTPS